MADKALPCPTRARLLVDYNPNTGGMVWRKRPRAFFKTDHEWMRWNTRYAGSVAFGQVNGDGYRCGCIDGARMKAHKLVFAILHGVWPNKAIDHINGNRQDNSAGNLRLATAQENARNSKARSGSSSRFKGVSFHRANRKWTAQISLDNRRVYLGSFNSEAAAAAAHNEAARRLHGEFARLNEV